MNIVVAIPWRSTPERDRAFRFVCSRYRALGLPVVTADAGGEGFNRAASRNLAMRLCASFDVVVLSDADCVFAYDSNLARAIAEAVDGRLHMPYTAQHYCTADETANIYAGDLTPLPGHEGSGACYVITPDAWERCGGMDERFGAIWGGEDDQLLAAATALIGVERHRGTVLSLHHADEFRPVGADFHRPNAVLAQRYHDARTNPAAIRALIAERDLT